MASTTIATDCAWKTEGVAAPHLGGFFTRTGEEGKPLLALHPRTENDDYCAVQRIGSDSKFGFFFAADTVQAVALFLGTRLIWSHGFSEAHVLWRVLLPIYLFVFLYDFRGQLRELDRLRS